MSRLFYKKIKLKIIMRKILILILTLFASISFAQVGKNQARKWRDDLVQLHSDLIARHVNVYHKTTEALLDSAVNLLYEEIPQLTTNQILVRVSQIVAQVGDGHTSFVPGNQKKKWFKFFPMKFWSFSEGTYVISTTERYSEFLAKKLISIENTPISEVYTKISTTIGADNEMEYVYSVPFEIPRPELLHVLGITTSDKMAEFHFENGSTTLYPIELKEWRNEKYICANTIYPDGKSPSQRVDFLFATELTLDSLKYKRYYWYTHLKLDNALYFQYNKCWNQKNRPTFEAIVMDMFNDLDEARVDRLIIDLRQNSGGEPLIAKPLIDELLKRIKYVDEGRVFVLVGRRTFSAALTNAVQLRKIGARIVGEAPRGKPNNPSERRDINLKATNIWATVSTQFVERDAELKDQDYLPIEIKCDLSFHNYQKGRDSVLEKALKAQIFN